MALVCGCSPYQPGWSCILHGNGDGKNTLATHTTIKSGFHGTWNGKRYMSVCWGFFFCSGTKCQSIPRSLELGITQLKYFFVNIIPVLVWLVAKQCSSVTVVEEPCFAMCF